MHLEIFGEPIKELVEVPDADQYLGSSLGRLGYAALCNCLSLHVSAMHVTGIKVI